MNPLGQAKHKHKVLAVYLSLANLTTHRRSNTDHVTCNVVSRKRFYTLAKTIFRAKFRLEDLEENGITVAEKTVKGTVFCIAGDNL